jgi:hypothetical protein
MNHAEQKQVYPFPYQVTPSSQAQYPFSSHQRRIHYPLAAHAIVKSSVGSIVKLVQGYLESYESVIVCLYDMAKASLTGVGCNEC